MNYDPSDNRKVSIKTEETSRRRNSKGGITVKIIATFIQKSKKHVQTYLTLAIVKYNEKIPCKKA